MVDIKTPDDLILPIPESMKEQDLYKTLSDYTKSVADTLSGLEDVEAVSDGDGITETDGVISVNVDDTTIEIATDKLQVKADGIDSDQIVDGSIDTAHIGDNQVTTAKLEDDLVFGTFPLTPSAAPDADYEVANKKYTDELVASIGIKGWINLNGQGTIAINDSFNVSSITDLGIGSYRVTWDTDFANTSYASVSGTTIDGEVSITVANTTHMDLYAVDSEGDLLDAQVVTLIAIGDQ